MKKVLNKVKNVICLLNQDMYGKERLEQYLSLIRIPCIIFSILMSFSVPYHYLRGSTFAGLCSLIFAFMFISGIPFMRLTKNRTFAKYFYNILTTSILALHAIKGTNDGFSILWSLFIPLGTMFFIDVKHGIIQSLILEVLYIALFWTPLRGMFMADKYNYLFMNHFPVLYGTSCLVFSIAMTKYHIRSLKQQDYDKQLKLQIDKLSAFAESRIQKNENLSRQMIIALVEAIDAKDKYTKGHSVRVSKYAVMIALRSGLFSQDEITQIEYASLLHDIGKIGIPKELINKTETISGEEFQVIKTHPIVGYEILSGVTEMPYVQVGARWHHEWYNGSGYPDGLSKDNIPVIARIICVADAYDAMTSNRSYRKYLSQQAVRQELLCNRGVQFDPVFADTMIEIIDEDLDYMLHE